MSLSGLMTTTTRVSALAAARIMVTVPTATHSAIAAAADTTLSAGTVKHLVLITLHLRTVAASGSLMLVAAGPMHRVSTQKMVPAADQMHVIAALLLAQAGPLLVAVRLLPSTTSQETLWLVVAAATTTAAEEAAITATAATAAAL